MTRLFLKILFVIIVTIVIIVGMFFYATKLSGPAFSKNYTAVFHTKYNQLINNDRDSSVILVGGSNLAFGIDQNVLSDKIDKPIINMGLHAGFNPLFTAEIVKDEVVAGDLIVLSFELDSYTSKGTFQKLGVSLVMQAIDSYVSIYQHLPISLYPQLIDNIIPFLNLKASVLPESTDCRENYVYTICSFDKFGQMIFPRPKAQITSEQIAAKHSIESKTLQLNDANIEYLIDFSELIRSKGAEVIIMAPAVSKDALLFSNEEYNNFFDEIAYRTGITVVGDPLNYTFETEFLYDTIYHLNTEGSRIRTLRVASDLIDYLESK